MNRSTIDLWVGVFVVAGFAFMGVLAGLTVAVAVAALAAWPAGVAIHIVWWMFAAGWDVVG